MPSRIVLVGIGAMVAMSFAEGAFAVEEYARGHGALEVFRPGDDSVDIPLWVQFWMRFLVLIPVTGLLFVLRQPIARWVVGGFILGMPASKLLFTALGLPVLSGSISIMHLVLWTPGLILLLKQRPFLDADQGVLFRIWSGAATFAILFSFIFDIRDAAIYVAHVSGLD